MCEVTLETGAIPMSSGLEREVVERVAWLERSYPGLSRCQAFLMGPERFHRHGPFRLRLELQAGELEIVAAGRAEPQISRALVSAFDCARRRLDEKLRRH